MSSKAIRVLGICVLLISVSAPLAMNGADDLLVLAQNGRTRYSIVISKNAGYGEDLAAKELALFLGQMTGAAFPIKGDNAPASAFEIVLGNTNRMSIRNLPRDLRTDNWEGFTLFRKGKKLYIMGNIPRGTVYGVYDFLDVELGVRFLTSEVTHVPKRPTLKLDMKSRMFGPKIERRTIWEGLGGRSIVRNRMNGAGFGVVDRKLGGVKWVGPQTHTFSSLMPQSKYFSSHPEYFAWIKGRRRKEYDGTITQICMSNPNVVRIATEAVRGWLGDGAKADPHNKYVVSVTVNDSPYFCKCAKCVAINREEGVNEGGTKMRFVNAIATQLAKEYPAVTVETMLYHTELPKITKPVSNVLIQLVADPDWRYAMDDPSGVNRQAMERFRRRKEQIGDGYFYNWIKLGVYGSHGYLDPRPNLRYIARNIRIMNEFGVKGFFCQTVQSRGTEMQALRYYLIARALWRPEIDSQETIEEFCRLYYGKAAPDVLRYIDFLHDEYGHKDRSVNIMGNTTAIYDDHYIRTGDAILAEAEAKAETAEIKRRVATCRLPIWKIQLDRSLEKLGEIFTFPVEWSFKIDPQDIGLKQGWQRTTSFRGWRKMRIDKHWTMQGEERRGVAWYGIKFDMPDTKGAPLALFFGAIDGDADIFIDGVKVGEQKISASLMWHESFFRLLPKPLTPGTHTIIVRVYKKSYNAGIWKKISLIDMSVPIPENIRTAATRFVKVARDAKLTKLSESYGGTPSQQVEQFALKIDFFLKHGRVR